MGSPFAFEYRRLELQNRGEGCADEDVVNSFCDVVRLPNTNTTCSSAATKTAHHGADVVDKGGIMLRYLELAQIVAVIGDVMYLHGAIHTFNKG